MPHLSVELPDDAFARLADQARRHGRTIEDEARALLLDRCAAREAIIDRSQARAAKYAPVTADELCEWRNEGRP